MHRHFTATAFVVDSKNRALLLWHKRLQRWMPPGGHVDPDETPEETAKRECKEETGLDVEIVGDPSENLFGNNPDEGTMLQKPVAFLLENIPASEERGEPAHQHMDFIYLARPRDDKRSIQILEAESSDWKWFTADEVRVLSEQTEIFSNVKEYVLLLLKEH